MNKSNVISGIVALIVAAIVAYLLGGGQTIIREFGATPGDTVTGNFWNVGGVEFYHADKGVNATTSAHFRFLRLEPSSNGRKALCLPVPLIRISPFLIVAYLHIFSCRENL